MDIESIYESMVEEYLSETVSTIDSIEIDIEELKLQIESIFDNVEYRKCTHDDVCSICIVDDGDFVSIDCGHAFHEQCIRKWISKCKTCPICRYKL